MRKTLALLTILVFLGPALGFLCDCCPLAAADPGSPAPVISKGDCDCCPPAIQVQEKETFQSQAASFGISFSRTLQAILAAALVGIPDFSEAPSRTSEISSSPSVPLYLTLQILRL